MAFLFGIIVSLVAVVSCMPTDDNLLHEIVNGTTLHPLFFDSLIKNNRMDLVKQLSHSEHYNLEFPTDIKGPLILNKDLYQGDIMLTKGQLEESRQGLIDTRYRWLNRRIPFWVDSNYPDNKRNDVQAGINRWNQLFRGCLEISNWRNGDNDWVHIINGGGCYSNLGRTGGRQELSLQSDGCTNPGTVMHEFLHACGVVHEQNRPDRDNSITIHWDNIEKSWQSQFQKTSANDVTSYGNYDCYSVMHYPRTHWQYSINNQPAFTTRIACDYNRVGNSNDLSQNDIAVIKRMYGC